MPVKDKPEVETKVNNAVTILLGDKDRIFWYFGEFKPGETQLEETNWSATGIRKILLEKNEKANERIRELARKLEKGQIADSTFKKERVGIQGEKESLFVLIKTDDKAKYKNVIDALDECNITNVGKYALVDMMAAELELMTQKYPQ